MRARKACDTHLPFFPSRPPSMPVSRENDRLRSRSRRLQDAHYANLQKETRTKRRKKTCRRTRTVRAPYDYSTFAYSCSAHVRDRTMKDVPQTWWGKFAPTMKRCRWTPPGWSRTCEKCSALLLDGEDGTFCCNNGKWIATPLPPLPAGLANVVDNSPSKRQLSSRSRSFNNLFCFTAIGASRGFQHFDSGPASVAITGRTYHRIFDIADTSHSLHWFLYDSLEREEQGKKFNVPLDWTRAFEGDIQTVNPYIRSLRRLSTVADSTPCALELTDVGQNGDFAAIFHAANTTSIRPRTVVVWQNSNTVPTFVPIFSRHYEPLQYPLLFPHGTPGWGLTEDAAGRETNTLQLTQREWYRSRLLTDSRFHVFGRVSCEYLCDMYSRIEEERLNFIRISKKNISQTAAVANVNDDDEDEQANVTLPASFMGSRKWASEQTADSLALARTYGPPLFFITMTCNPEWPEIKSRLLPGQDACDIPVVVVRVFKNRLQCLMQILKTKMGSITYMTSSNEFQKRGLPHSHIVLQVRELHYGLKNALTLLYQDASRITRT